MKFLFLLGLQILFYFSSQAQNLSEQEKIQFTIQQFFRGMKNGDSTLIKESINQNCFLKTVVIDKQTNSTIVREEEIEDFIIVISAKREGIIYDEQILNYEIKIDDPMAIVWAPYRFYVNERFVHCGVNAFSIARFHSEWKIIGILDTRRKESCD